MSSFMFIGVREKLEKVRFSAKDIYNIPEIYKNNLWFSDGLLFDENVIPGSEATLKEISKSYYWYQINGFLTPLGASLRYKEDCPDLYEAALQMSQWFLNFIKELKSQDNDILLIKLWLGKGRKSKISKKNLNISILDLGNYEIPIDIVYNLNCK